MQKYDRMPTVHVIAASVHVIAASIHVYHYHVKVYEVKVFSCAGSLLAGPVQDYESSVCRREV